MTKTAALFDMDGTLVEVSSLRHLVTPEHPRFPGRKRFDLFHGNSHTCPPNQIAIDLYERLRREHSIVIVTARKGRYALHTLLWLRDHGIEHDRLMMRKDDDNRPDVDVKRDMLNELRRDLRPLVAVDDNPAVVQLWRSEGLVTHVVPGWEDRGRG